jgi:putative phosphonate metabolism protein
MRAALYWAPERSDPLHALGSRWLGRDAETGAAMPQPAIPGLDLAALTEEPRRYGLHATLKPPFRLAAPWPELEAAATALAARTRPFLLPPLRVAPLHGFLALRETAPCAELRRFADACVVELDAFRAPPSAGELERRRRGLGPAQQALLQRWGYPYVLEEWRFHVTLTCRLAPADLPAVRTAAEALLGAAAGRPREVRELCLFTQAAPDAPFLIAARLPLRG